MFMDFITSYSVRRTGAAIITMMAASVIIFAFIHLIPGDPMYVLLGDGATPDQVEALRHKMGWIDPYLFNIWLGLAMRFRVI